MSEWIKATRESAGYYADEKPLRHDLRTCTQRQDAELARLAAALDDLLIIVTPLATNLYTLSKRVTALEAQHETRIDAADYNLDAVMTALSNTKHEPADATLRQYCAAVDGEDV